MLKLFLDNEPHLYLRLLSYSVRSDEVCAIKQEKKVASIV